MDDPGSSSVALQPKSLVHLPKELLHLVASSLDITSALSLLTTSKLLSQPAESRIWSEIGLTLPDHHGEHPLERPYAHGTHEYCNWAKGAAKAAEHRARDDLDKRVKEIMMASNKRRLGYVKNLELMARAGSATSSAFFLSCVASRLESLTIVPPLKHIWDENWQPEYHETFYARLHDLGSSNTFRLPALRSLDITLSTGVEYVDSILLLLEAAAPTLEELRLDMSANIRGIDEDMSRTGPNYPDGYYDITFSLRKLKTLTVIYPGVFHDTLDIALQTATNLQMVTIRGACKPSPGLDEDFAEHLRTCGVQELKWTKRHMMDFLWEWHDWEGETGVDAFEFLTTLVLEHQTVTSPPCIEFTPIPSCNQLETLMIQIPSWKPQPPAQIVSDDPSPFDITLSDYQAIPEPLAGWLRERASSLHTIQYFPHKKAAAHVHLKNWDTKDCQGAFIRSFSPNDTVQDVDDEQSLLHIRSRTQWLTANAFEATYPPGTNRSVVVSYPADLDEKWGTMLKSLEEYEEPPRVDYVYTSECQWTDMTDYRGHVVPPEVMLRMQRAEGLTSAQSQKGRDITVGAKGWKILKDWYNEQEDVKAAKVAEEEVEETVDEEVPNSQDSV